MIAPPDKRQVQIVNSKTGAIRMSEPVRVQTPNAQENPPPLQVSSSTAPAPQSDGGSHSPGEELGAAEGGTAGSTEHGAKASKVQKPKLEIETFEQFVEYAYRRRGQPVKLDPKTQEAIAKRPMLDEHAMTKLLKLINADILLAVPRQILLASREVSGLPVLRGALTDFVAGVMLRHPAFASEGVKAAIRNLPQAPRASEALTTVAAFVPADSEGVDALKPSELKELRRNATRLLVTWFALHRGANLEDVADLLFHSLWEPAARELVDDADRLRALTEVENSAGIGVVAFRYRQQLADARGDRDKALREAGVLRQQVVEVTGQREATQAQLANRVSELEALRASTTEELQTLRRDYSAGRMQQGHEFESLRGRLVQRLEESIDMLDTGLSALRKEPETPRIAVMLQRAEVVIDALRSELNSLRET